MIRSEKIYKYKYSSLHLLLYLIFGIVTYTRDTFSISSKSVSFRKKQQKIFLSKIQFYFKLHMTKSLENKNKNHICINNNNNNIRHDLTSLKIQKIFLLIFLHVFLDLIINLLKSWELDLYFKNTKKFILFSFNIWDYEFIRKIYFQYWIKRHLLLFIFFDIRMVRF